MNASVDDVKEFVGENQQAALAMAEGFFRTTADQLEYWVVPASAQVSGLGDRTLLIAAPRGAGGDRPQEARRDDRRERGPRRDSEREARGDRGDRGERGGRGDRERGRERGERGERGGRAAREERSESRPEREPAPRAEAPAVEESPAPSGPLGEVGKFVVGLLERMKLNDVTAGESESDGLTTVTVAGKGIVSLAEREPRLLAALSHLAHRAAEAMIGEEASAQVEIRGVRRAPREDSRERGGRDRDSRRGGGRDGGRRDDRPRGGRDSDDRDIDEVELERLAKDSARDVRDSGEPKLLPPMNSRERWFVHNALKDERGVRSESEGEGARKRIKIIPA